MNLSELEVRIGEIQQELSTVKEVSTNPGIFAVLWGISFLAAILLIIVMLFLILREEEGFTIKNIISVLADNLRPSSIKEKLAALSHKKKVTFFTVVIACVLVIAASVTAAILIGNYTKPRWVTATFTAQDKYSDEPTEYIGAYALKIEKHLGGEVPFSIDNSGVIILQDKEYEVSRYYFNMDRYFIYLISRGDKKYIFSNEKICIDMTTEFDDIQIKFLD